MRRKLGYTLVELMMVVGICGLFFAFAFPALWRFKNSVCIKASALELASGIRRIQSEAVCRGENLSVGRFKFSRSGFPLPGGSGTQVLENRFGRSRRVIVSAVGRVRVE
ncbi:prepilin-type N-terminal cleavage/methylation domain-containing protein [Candidatus Saganbacteria bacterium]|uniref:Prepilin-type N-terminal cleavage/methylation domain-containing protein n=1 Tax=Candidatus Saganbacteria bacterium TaxID=2575572 RepID=A0A9D6ULY7_UNCSA|nr:prepilin-type N-terminal cleavage/methylation domain-containing protein [Candidatus Saganbacteria bacterium]